MNVYDFDETIYDGDCTRDFVFYCVKRYPNVLVVLPKVTVFGLRYLFKNITKTVFKENLYSFLKHVPNIETVCDTFVLKNKHKIKKWYLEQQREDDLIISASPEFLIGRFCKEVGINHYMASKVNIFNGKYEGENCYGEEKVRRYDVVYKRGEIEQFYSDSYSDDPLAKLAKESYLVQGNQIKGW